jgi:hypothetical protein
MKNLVLFFIGIACLALISSTLSAQIHEETDSQERSKKIMVIAELHELISTHTTYFKGGNLVLSYPATRKVFIGLGTEYSYVNYHFDNGYDLTNFKLIPVFIDSRVKLLDGTKFVPFLRLSTGITFASYLKQDKKIHPPSPSPPSPSSSPSPYQVNEKGLYLYTGMGFIYSINKYFGLVVEAGFTGYHMSLNNLDVNPHGLVFGLGLVF